MIEKKLLTLNLDRGDIRKIMQTIERDVEFLQQCSFMDYSLLLGVEKVGDNADVPVADPLQPKNTIQNKDISLHSKQSLYFESKNIEELQFYKNNNAFSVMQVFNNKKQKKDKK